MKKRTNILTLWAGLIIITGLFFTCNITTALGATVRVMIDPGHGGTDKGVKLSRKISEKDVTLAIAKHIHRAFAKDKKVTVKLTRSNDRNISIDARKKAAASFKADLFLSLHVNKGFGTQSSGYEIYFSGFTKKTSSKASSKKVVSDMIENRYLNESIRFSHIVEKNIGTVFPRKGRGMRGAPVAVLAGLDMPAIVIELGFASNIKDKDKLLDTKIQKSLAKALAKSIKSFF